jgi:hypothetical protein
MIHFEDLIVKKRNGRIELISFDKIHRVIEWAARGFDAETSNKITKYPTQSFYNLQSHTDYFYTFIKFFEYKFSNLNKFFRLVSREDLCKCKNALVFFFNFRRKYQELVVNFTKYIVAKYIHKISLVKNDGLQNHLQNFNNLNREILYDYKPSSQSKCEQYCY